MHGREVHAPRLLDGQDFHLFLSHVWSTGQDQMRIIKQLLVERIPDLSVFLDVDDLKEGRGAEYIMTSDCVLVFLSAGYFQSVNCMRELLSALVTGKRLVTLVELEVNHGGLSREQVLEHLREADRRYCEQWGDANLGDEVAKWLRELRERTKGDCTEAELMFRQVATRRSEATLDSPSAPADPL